MVSTVNSGRRTLMKKKAPARKAKRSARPATSSKEKSAEFIAAADMPGWKAIKEPIAKGDTVSASADAKRPSIETLRKKYLGTDATSEDVVNIDTQPSAGSDTQIVTFESGPLKKRVGVKQGKVVWSEG
jgi:hypothetical protein